MGCQTVPVNAAVPPADALLISDPALAARTLAAGGLVGLPTETVYGLAADAENRAAVARIYAVKGRPAGHPVIAHVADASALRSGWTEDGALTGYAYRLAQELWPGPLTLIVPRGPRAGDWITGGLAAVGLRCPAHPVAQAVLLALAEVTGRDHPAVAAPSANRFGRVSPTRAEDVLAELGDALDPLSDKVLQAGSSRIGIESTIVDCTSPEPVILRPGAISAAVVGAAGGVRVTQRAPSGGVSRAPGTLAAHYAPRARVHLLPAGTEPPQPPAAGAPSTIGLIAARGVPTPAGVVRLAEPADAEQYARALYTALRSADELGLAEVVAIAPAPGTGPADGDALIPAIIDRLTRAATGSGTPDPA